jgi:hypothetical protein
VAGLSGDDSKIVLYDVRTRKQARSSVGSNEFLIWSQDSRSLFFNAPGWTLWRASVRDGKVETAAQVKGLHLTNWRWIGAAPNNSILIARNTGTEEIYALDWELP